MAGGGELAQSGLASGAEMVRYSFFPSLSVLMPFSPEPRAQSRLAESGDYFKITRKNSGKHTRCMNV